MSSCQIDTDQLSKKQVKNLESIISKLPANDVLSHDSDIFKALADPTRIKIIHLLEKGELCACEIIIALDKSQPTVSHHLNILKKAGFLNWRKEGVWIHYRLKHPEIPDMISKLIKSTE